MYPSLPTKLSGSITGNATSPTRFTQPVCAIYTKERLQQRKCCFSVASGGSIGRTLHPDNMKAKPDSCGMTDTMGRMHCDAQFADSSSVPAHVEMMGCIGMGNNPLGRRHSGRDQSAVRPGARAVARLVLP